MLLLLIPFVIACLRYVANGNGDLAIVMDVATDRVGDSICRNTGGETIPVNWITLINGVV